MIDKRHASDVMDARSYRGGDSDSDNFFVIMKYRQRFQHVKGTKQIRFKVKQITKQTVRKDLPK